MSYRMTIFSGADLRVEGRFHWRQQPELDELLSRLTIVKRFLPGRDPYEWIDPFEGFAEEHAS